MNVPYAPDPATARAREIACAEVARCLEPHLHPDGLRVSPLGPAWSRDVDAYVTRRPDPAALAARGWLPLDGLLGAIGSPGEGRWAVVVGGEVVGAADVHVGEPPDPVERVLHRCRRQGRVGARERAELAALGARGHAVPRQPRVRPIPLWRSWAGKVRRAVRPRLVVAIGGVDGAGKSTLTRHLLDALHRAGVPASRVWVRPGFTSPAVAALARLAKRVLRQDPAPGVVRVAAGAGGGLASRRGLLGRAWTGVVLASFCAEVWRQYAASRGVVLFDRHVADARVTLRVFYPGSGGLADWLVARALPRARLAARLHVPAAVAVARKPGDTVGEWAVARQLQEYDRLADPSVLVLDGRRPPEELVLTVLRALTTATGGAR